MGCVSQECQSQDSKPVSLLGASNAREQGDLARRPITPRRRVGDCLVQGNESVILSLELLIRLGDAVCGTCRCLVGLPCPLVYLVLVLVRVAAAATTTNNSNSDDVDEDGDGHVGPAAAAASASQAEEQKKFSLCASMESSRC